MLGVIAGDVIGSRFEWDPGQDDGVPAVRSVVALH
jgi:hypothetical protein